MLLVVRVVLKVNGIPPTSTPPMELTLLEGIELKIGRTNYLGGLTKWVKFYICNSLRVVWAMG